VDELCLHAALVYWPVGCLWLVISRAGVNPLGFSDDIVLLTAVHFHYAGFAALTMLGMTGRFAKGMVYRETTWRWGSPFRRVLNAPRHCCWRRAWYRRLGSQRSSCCRESPTAARE
jgi:hypothetical protein